MPRNAIYTLLTKNGPTEAEQVAAVRRRLQSTKADEVYTDDLTKRRRKSDHQFPARVTLIKQLRRGDTVAISSPGRLGIGRDDVRGALHAIAAKGCSVLDASTGKRVTWTEEIADGLEFLDRGAIEHKADILRAARAAKAAAGIVYTPEPKALAVSEDAAERVWRDRVRYTREQTEEVCGVSWRTLHTRFGGRTKPMGYRPEQEKKRAKRKR